MELTPGNVLAQLAWHLPFALVAGLGMVAALARWRLDPGVSALVAGTLAVALAGRVASTVAKVFAVQRLSASATTASGDVSVVHFPVIDGLSTFVGAATWIAMLIAAFGWRQPAAAPGISGDRGGWQFSLRGLMLLTLAVAVLCALVRGAAELLATESVLLRNWVNHLPIVVCWLVGLQWAIRRWRWQPHVSGLVVIAIASSFLSHALVFLVLFWVTRPGSFDAGGASSLRQAYLLSALLNVVTWALLIAAALGWRQRQPPGAEPLLLEVADPRGQPAP